MKHKKLLSILAIFTVLGLVLVVSAHGAFAASGPSYVPDFLKNQYANGSSGINTLIHNIIEFVFAITGLVVLGFIIFAGFKFITSGGDSGKKEEAQKQIVAAVIGLLIIVFSFFIVQLIFSLLGLGSVQDIKLPCGGNINQSTSGGCVGTETATPATGQ